LLILLHLLKFEKSNSRACEICLIHSLFLLHLKLEKVCQAIAIVCHRLAWVVGVDNQGERVVDGQGARVVANWPAREESPWR